ncbi:PREDICTED: probable 2-oxoglutarate dehydrogenase E1 component DHKTD1, mitochondrial [Amphimedon queenslandica]|uniref:Transketolase-like pyrimidine-binding domain-containing protein n=1 Tax=Amphimedon queenslandica TaxID=400682 RepID=A0A1X7VEJ3_AMPQE|nr:PREDICTED: probable 2-oxoglutarate dehydrogenase E1 component DHKTD1, mitochondrial [Amphimedon queenslandica]|eukprot:XP_011402465.1 PREDICTED: probable 2-oxoglutarate dehydrogenase E1 component DHKTD1, mitochondrial [Amphimedon queenslandica]
MWRLSRSVTCLPHKNKLKVGTGGAAAGYHTENCFGYWRKPRAIDPVQKEWIESRSRQPNIWRLVTSYQNNGHKTARTDPLGINNKWSDPIELNPEVYGLDNNNYYYDTLGILHCFEGGEASLSDIINYLNKTYCGNTAIEVSHIMDPGEREWVLRSYETHVNSSLGLESHQRLGTGMIKSQVLDQFLAKKFPTVKRYGGEGAEAMIGFTDELFDRAADVGVSDVLVGMSHRGRLNLLIGLMEYPPVAVFNKIKGNSEFSDAMTYTGDVLSHLTSSVDISRGGRSLHVTMLPNPSHLEAVNPVLMGKTRGRMLSRLTGPYQNDNTSSDRSNVLSFLVHGDASFSAQGVVMECLSISEVPHYEVGGTIHLVVNNNLGFTTPHNYGRSSMYCSDIGKMNGVPIVHVNGSYPEDVLKVSRFAVDYWNQFNKDVIIVLNCYRRWGHNELDDPSITQPQMYRIINKLKTIPDTYWEENVESFGDVSSLTQSYYDELNNYFKEVDNFKSEESNFKCQWKDMVQPAASGISEWDTGLDIGLLKYIGERSVAVPKGMRVHDRLQSSHISERLSRLVNDKIDWSTAEALAIGSLLYQGVNVRVSGQDVGRGTFSHRHMMIIDQETNGAVIPLNSIREDQGHFIEVANSPLSEEAVLGYEYGYSIENPNHLVIWEAQYGDFFNGGQIMIDAFISSGEDKWLYQSGLVMCLPHGYDGAGPEHSSSRIERFLQMTNSSEEGGDSDSVNINVVHPTTPSQYYHVLRRQMVRNFRKPLIIQSPKTLLRLPSAVSSLNEMSPGTTFKPVIGDHTIKNKDSVERIVLCSGKHYYALDSYRKENNIENVPIIRIELLCPFPSGSLYDELYKYKQVKEFVWSQEEPANMGVWSFIEPRMRKQLGINLHRVSRVAYGPPATGITRIHQQEAKKILQETFS